jgi:muramidase (phage lysozyme)
MAKKEEESRLAQILRQELKAGKGLADALTSSYKERQRERSDFRKYFPKGGVAGLALQSMFGKPYQYKDRKTTQQQTTQTKTQTTNLSYTKKLVSNTSDMARDMRIMKINMIRFVSGMGIKAYNEKNRVPSKVNTNVKSGTSGTSNRGNTGSGILGQTVGGLFGAASFATDVAGGIVRGIVGVLGSGFKIGAGILGGLASVLGSVIGGVLSIGGGVIGGIFRGLAAAFSGMGLMGVIALAGAGFLVYQLSKSITGSLNFEDLQKGIIDSFQKLFGKDKNGKGPLDRIAESLDNFFNTNKFTENLNRATNLIENTFNTIMSHGIAAAKTLGDVMGTIGQDLVNFSKKWMYEQTENIYVLMGATIGAVLGSTMGTVGAVVGGVLGKKAAEEMFKFRSKEISKLSQEYMWHYGNEAGATEQLNKQISTAREFLQTDKNRLLDNDAQLNLKDPNTRKWLANFLSLRSRGKLSPEHFLKEIESQERNAPGNSAYKKTYTIGKIKDIMHSDEEVLAKIQMSKDFESQTKKLDINDIYQKNLADARQQYPEIPYAPSRVSNRNLSDILNMIGAAEGGQRGYDAVNKGKAGDTPQGYPGLSDLTVGQVMELQANKKIFAAGKYQIIPPTLAQLIKDKILKPDDKFSPENQDKLAMELINRRLKKAGSDTFSQQLELSKEFAAIENPLTGKSYHHGKAGNRASISTKQIQLALRGSEGSEPIVASSTKPVPAPNVNSQADKLSEKPEKEFTEIFMEEFDKAFGTNFSIEGQKMTAQQQQINLLTSINKNIQDLAANKGSGDTNSNNPLDPHHGLYRRAVN